MSDPDRIIDRVVSELQRPVPVDPEAKARLLEAVRRAGRGGRQGWLARLASAFEGRRVMAVAGAAAVLLTLVLATLWSGGSNSAAARPVQFVYVGPEASQVHLVGDFNDWDRSATPLHRGATGEIWSVTLSLAPGPYRYAFIVDGERWIADDEAPKAPADEFGVPNSVIIVERAS